MRRGIPDQIFAVMKNTSSAVLSDGDLVRFDFSAPAADLGLGVIKSSGATLIGIIGIVSGIDMQPGDFGLIQCYGVHFTAKADAGLGAGNDIKSSATAGQVALGSSADDPQVSLGFAIGATVSGRAPVFLKCM